MKKYLTIMTLALCVCYSGAYATDMTYANTSGTGDPNWSNPANWPTGLAPVAADWIKIYGPTGTLGETRGCIVTNSCVALQLRVGGDTGGLNSSTLRIVDGGTLTIGDFMMVGTDASTSRSGNLLMTGGTINIANHFDIGYSGTYTVGRVTMSGGAINVTGAFKIGVGATTKGYVYLNGGTITAASMTMGGTVSQLDIAGGKLVLPVAQLSVVQGYAANNKIIAFGGTGTLVYDTTTDPAKVMVTALPPATVASNPSPANFELNVSPNAQLTWTAGAGAVSHDVYFGTSNPPALIGNQASTSYNPGPLSAATTYYWRVDEVTAGSIRNTGAIWTFTTGVVKAAGPTPANGTMQVNTTPTLSWTAGMGASSHTVYFGTTNPPALIGTQSGTSLAPGTLSPDTTYYWRVDENGTYGTITGDTWNFSTASAIKKGPYLVYPGDNTEMQVLWQLASSASCTLRWGTDTNYSVGSTLTTEFGTDHQHKYTITGLSAGTKYYYQLTTDMGTYTGSFVTAPSADAQKVKFFAYGDTRTNVADHGSVCSRMLNTIAADPEYQSVLLHVGDWSNDDTESAWSGEWFNRSITTAIPQLQSMIPIQGVLGNHETMEGTPYGKMLDKYYPYPYAGSGHYWSFDYGPAHIALIDQYTDYSTGSAQLTWLENDLASSTKNWKIIVLHEPGWSAGGGHQNELPVQDRIQPLCEKYGVQIVFGGHNHYYARAVVNGVHHVTTGDGGAPSYTPVAGQPNIVLIAKVLQFCTVEIDGSELLFKAVKNDGTIVDAFGVSLNEPDFMFIQNTDPQIDPAATGAPGTAAGTTAAWQTAVQNITRVQPSLVVITGDMIQSSTNTAQADLFWAEANKLDSSIIFRTVPGNHDIGQAPNPTSYSWYISHFGQPWWSLDYNNCLFIGLDSEVLCDPSGYPGKDTEQMTWLTNTLVAAQAQGYNHTFVFMHHSLAATSVTEPFAYAYNMPLPIRNTLLSLFHTYGVDAVFAGHYHKNAYVRDGMLEIFTTNTSGSPLGSPPDPVGFRVVKVYPRHYEQTYHAMSEFTTLAADLNGDDVVDFKDLAIMLGDWLKVGMWP